MIRSSRIFLFCTCFCLSTSVLSQNPSGYAVASSHPLATQAGLSILAQGGNAFDAAVAVAATLAVVEPYHTGLGGGGMWLLYQAKTNRYIFIDGRETAPRAATKDMFVNKAGQTISDLSLNGGLAAAIPGEPAALAMIAEKYGQLPLAQSLAPAIRLANEGFEVDHQFNYFETMLDRLALLKHYPASAAIFLKNGQPYRPGERLIQKDLAHTLQLLAAKGRDGFYQGEVASKLVKAVNQAGGQWSLADLADYQAKIRQPLIGKYHQMKIITAPPPAAGGVALIMMLNLLEPYALDSLSKAKGVHYLVEAMRLSFWQRSEYLADPDFVTIPLKDLLSARNAAKLRQWIKPNRATASQVLPTQANDFKPLNNTSHFSILDGEGNRVAATVTINFIFGSGVVADGTGVLLNDEMDDFSINPTAKNVYGLVGGTKNEIAPGKRPLSSMAPTFLEMPDRIAILGTPGGSRIPTMVFLAALNFADSLGAITLVSAMRFHHQYLPDELQFEPDTFSDKVQAELIQMGYHLMPLKQYYGDMQAITWDLKNNFITAASDPRHIGLSAVVKKQNTEGYGFSH